MTDSNTRAITGIDHVIQGVDDLERARATYARLGFRSAPIGHHQGRATSNYCLMLRHSYIELLGVLRPELDSGGLLDSLSLYGEGLQRLALATPDADLARADLEVAGLHPEGPLDLARPSEDPPGMVRFRNLMLPKGDTADLPMFLCGHKTPALMRKPEWLAHENGALDLTAVTVVVDDPAAVAAALGRIFGPGSVAKAAHGMSVSPGRGTLELTTAAEFGQLHPGARPPLTPSPCYCALTIAVAAPDATASWLVDQGVPYERTARGVRVAAADAHGTLIEFVAA